MVNSVGSADKPAKKSRGSRDQGYFRRCSFRYIVFGQFQVLPDIGEKCPVYQTTRLEVHFRLRRKSD